VFIDDLEPPWKKGKLVDSIYSWVEKTKGYSAMNAVRQAYIIYKTQSSSAYHLLLEIEQTLGIINGLKCYWALAVAQKAEVADMHKEMRKSVAKMAFRNKDCILAICNTYEDIFTAMLTSLSSYLATISQQIDVFSEGKLNSMTMAFYGLPLGHLYQFRTLHQYLSSSEAMSLLQSLFFQPIGNLVQAFTPYSPEDLCVILLYLAICTLKSRPEYQLNSSIPFDSLKSKFPSHELDPIPISGKPNLPGEASADFPRIQAAPTQTNHLEILRQKAIAMRDNGNGGVRVDRGVFSGRNGPSGGVPAGVAAGVKGSALQPILLGNDVETVVRSMGLPYPIPLMNTQGSTTNKKRPPR
jgi:hypothetical protein